jgi:hypothetical protein
MIKDIYSIIYLVGQGEKISLKSKKFRKHNSYKKSRRMNREMNFSGCFYSGVDFIKVGRRA